VFMWPSQQISVFMWLNKYLLCLCDPHNKYLLCLCDSTNIYCVYVTLTTNIYCVYVTQQISTVFMWLNKYLLCLCDPHNKYLLFMQLPQQISLCLQDYYNKYLLRLCYLNKYCWVHYEHQLLVLSNGHELCSLWGNLDSHGIAIAMISCRMWRRGDRYNLTAFRKSILPPSSGKKWFSYIMVQ